MSAAGIRLPAAVRRAVLAHARRDTPRECCGLLVGTPRAILFAVAMPNVAPNPTVRYRIDDRSHIELRRTLREFSPPLVIRGVYHSHPRGDAVPSETDVAEALYPDWLYVIAGFGPRVPRVRAFRIHNRRVEALLLR